MTATPNRKEGADNVEYFGKPVYEYSLKQGIDEGYLAPYKVLRVTLDKDLGWRPEAGMRDDNQVLIEDREYNQKDMNRELVLTERDKVVARRITRFLKETDRFSKTIVFDEDIKHAGRMRMLWPMRTLTSWSIPYLRHEDHWGRSRRGRPNSTTFSLGGSVPRNCLYKAVYSPLARYQDLYANSHGQKYHSMTEFKQIIGRGRGSKWNTVRFSSP
jgi:hypothetical protein